MRNPDGPDMDNFNLVNLLMRNQRVFLTITIVTIVLSVIFSSPFFITPLYKSTVILYPTSTNSISKALLNTNYSNNKDLLEFGEDEQTERMLQILNSNKIRDRIIEKYDLTNHYNIPEGTKYRFTKLFKEYDSKIKFRRTEYMAVKITVLDKDPGMAALIANDIAELFDSTMNVMQKEVAVKAFNIVETEYFSLRDEVKQMEDSLNMIRRLGIHDYESQAEMINQQLAIELAKNNSSGIKALYEKLDLLSQYGGAYVSLRDNLEHERKQLSQIKAKYEEAKVDATENLPHKFVVTSAFKAERKSYPIRWLIVVISLFSTLLIAMIVLVIIDQANQSAEKKKAKSTKNTKSSFRQFQQLATKFLEAAKPNKQQHLSIMDNFFNNTSLVGLVFKWRIHLAVITVLAAILGAVFSGPYFITPLYKSEAVAYPANINSYSDESETEQMLQMIQGQDITDSMIVKFNLLDVYEIDPNYKYMRTIVQYEYNQNVKIKKTPYEAISIVVRDKDPQRASDMAAEILRLYDQKVAMLHKTKYREVVDMYDMQLILKKKTIDSLQNRMMELGTNYGLVDYSAQSQEVMRGYLRTVMGANSTSINTKAVEELKRNIGIYGGELLTLIEMLQRESSTYVEIKLDYESALRFLNASLTYSNIISKPFPSDKKAFPVRWVIVVLSSLGALLLSVLVIFAIENRQKLPVQQAK